MVISSQLVSHTMASPSPSTKMGGGGMWISFLKEIEGSIELIDRKMGDLDEQESQAVTRGKQIKHILSESRENFRVTIYFAEKILKKVKEQTYEDLENKEEGNSLLPVSEKHLLLSNGMNTHTRNAGKSLRKIDAYLKKKKSKNEEGNLFTSRSVGFNRFLRYSTSTRKKIEEATRFCNDAKICCNKLSIEVLGLNSVIKKTNARFKLQDDVCRRIRELTSCQMKKPPLAARASEKTKSIERRQKESRKVSIEEEEEEDAEENEEEAEKTAKEDDRNHVKGKSIATHTVCERKPSQTTSLKSPIASPGRGSAAGKSVPHTQNTQHVQLSRADHHRAFGLSIVEDAISVETELSGGSEGQAKRVEKRGEGVPQREEEALGDAASSAPPKYLSKAEKVSKVSAHTHDAASASRLKIESSMRDTQKPLNTKIAEGSKPSSSDSMTRTQHTPSLNLLDKHSSSEIEEQKRIVRKLSPSKECIYTQKMKLNEGPEASSFTSTRCGDVECQRSSQYIDSIRKGHGWDLLDDSDESHGSSITFGKASKGVKSHSSHCVEDEECSTHKTSESSDFPRIGASQPKQESPLCRVSLSVADAEKSFAFSHTPLPSSKGSGFKRKDSPGFGSFSQRCEETQLSSRVSGGGFAVGKGENHLQDEGDEEEEKDIRKMGILYQKTRKKWVSGRQSEEDELKNVSSPDDSFNSRELQASHRFDDDVLGERGRWGGDNMRGEGGRGGPCRGWGEGGKWGPYNGWGEGGRCQAYHPWGGVEKLPQSLHFSNKSPSSAHHPISRGSRPSVEAHTPPLQARRRPFASSPLSYPIEGGSRAKAFYKSPPKRATYQKTPWISSKSVCVEEFGSDFSDSISSQCTARGLVDDQGRRGGWHPSVKHKEGLVGKNRFSLSLPGRKRRERRGGEEGGGLCSCCEGGGEESEGIGGLRPPYEPGDEESGGGRGLYPFYQEGRRERWGGGRTSSSLEGGRRGRRVEDAYPPCAVIEYPNASMMESAGGPGFSSPARRRQNYPDCVSFPRWRARSKYPFPSGRWAHTQGQHPVHHHPPRATSSSQLHHSVCQLSPPNHHDPFPPLKFYSPPHKLIPPQHHCSPSSLRSHTACVYPTPPRHHPSSPPTRQPTFCTHKSQRDDLKVSPGKRQGPDLHRFEVPHRRASAHACVCSSNSRRTKEGFPHRSSTPPCIRRYKDFTEEAKIVDEDAMTSSLRSSSASVGELALREKKEALNLCVEYDSKSFRGGRMLEDHQVERRKGGFAGAQFSPYLQTKGGGGRYHLNSADPCIPPIGSPKRNPHLGGVSEGYSQHLHMVDEGGWVGRIAPSSSAYPCREEGRRISRFSSDYKGEKGGGMRSSRPKGGGGSGWGVEEGWNMSHQEEWGEVARPASCYQRESFMRGNGGAASSSRYYHEGGGESGGRMRSPSFHRLQDGGVAKRKEWGTRRASDWRLPSWDSWQGEREFGEASLSTGSSKGEQMIFFRRNLQPPLQNFQNRRNCDFSRFEEEEEEM